MRTRATARATVFVDADNTLWETDSVFAKAQLNLLERVAASLGISTPSSDPLAFVRDVDQGLAERHHAGLRYPPKLLIRGVAFALHGLPAFDAAKSAFLGSSPASIGEGPETQIEQRYFSDIAVSPELRPGVREGLDLLQDAKCLVLVVTEAAVRKTEMTAAKLGLSGHFDRVIEGRKRPALYQRIIRLVGTPGRAFMVGDQLDRDIAPAKAAGLETIYFPGNFKPRWQPGEEMVGPDHRVTSFAEVAAIVLGQTATRRR